MRGQGLDAYQGAGQKLQCTPWSPRPQEGAKDRVQRERPGRDVLMGGGVRDTSPEVTFNQQVATTSPDSQRQIPRMEIWVSPALCCKEL